MAQKTENEETEFKLVTETITPCINNRSVTGTPSSPNLCQNCFNSSEPMVRKHRLAPSPLDSMNPTVKRDLADEVEAEGEAEVNRCSGCQKWLNSSSSLLIVPKPARKPRVSALETVIPAREIREKRDLVVDESEEVESVPAKRAVNRCSGCRKKVGLTGFRCRCGELFCGEHRYSDRHECGFDYKLAGREAIARENPVVKAAKIAKI